MEIGRNNPLEKPNGLSFGALYGLIPRRIQSLAKLKEYNATLAKKSDTKPTVLSGAMFQDQWYVPQGESLALFLKDAQAIIYGETRKVLKCILAFEVILEKAQQAEFLTPVIFLL
jgi:iron complex transport system substrate-binding protein